MILSSNPGRRLRRIAGACAVLAALAGCGGGTEQREVFQPSRVIVFGDEASALTADGRKYSVNGLREAAPGIVVFDCRVQPTWAQSVADFYGFVFRQCNPDGVEDLRAIAYAAAGAQVADLAVQVDAQIANGGFQTRDLVTVLVGANDIVELYRQFPQRSEADLVQEAQDRGRRLAEQVNRIVGLGAKVLLATVPDLGITPYAIRQRAEFGDTDRAALLSRLSAAFNEQLGVNIVLDGTKIGLVAADVRVQAMARAAPAFRLSNVTDPACLATVTLVDCNSLTLVEGAGGNPATYLWADELRFSYAAQAQIAALAIDRATRNPF